ncbi:MAG: lytic transglycosylase domain-containing protein, partial [Alphaproteobacteria bacterium]|nr:lytic transglycosylase domain-containing protein [Alphaproteobacteria bacterium]
LTRIAGNLDSDDDAPRYPAPDWEPETGWTIDKALVFAFVKQESCFNEKAKSSVGAMGLMQLMPSNAREIARRLKLKWDQKKLTEPEYNLALGQNYLEWLMKDKQIQNNLLFTAVAYNSGPGNLNKLKNKMKYNDDPLLFIESIPFRETRGFVERIMANYWIYQTLMNQEVSSLDRLIEGCWPLYVTQDNPIACEK